MDGFVQGKVHVPCMDGFLMNNLVWSMNKLSFRYTLDHICKILFSSKTSM